MGDYLSVGELASYFGLNVQTLHFYDKAGVLHPGVRDQKTGRRWYLPGQIYELANICYMRRLGYSLEEIRNSRKNLHIENSLQYLRKRSDDIQRQLQELLRCNEAIERKIHFVETEMRQIDVSQVCIRHFPKRRTILIGDETNLYRGNFFYLYPTVVYYENGKKNFAVYLCTEEELSISVSPQDIRDLPEGDYLCGYHLGQYSMVLETAKHIRQLHPELKLSDNFVNFNIVDQFLESNKDRFITSMQFKILQ